MMGCLLDIGVFLAFAAHDMLMPNRFTPHANTPNAARSRSSISRKTGKQSALKRAKHENKWQRRNRSLRHADAGVVPHFLDRGDAQRQSVLRAECQNKARADVTGC